MPGLDSESQDQVRYVEVAPPSGWQTMAKTVWEIDEDKVQDCKEDIDTLLVFAGLYSAVLSAFLIESYTALQPDTNAQMIYLLERIATQTQSYTFTSGSLNSTAQSPSSIPKFTAPLWAVRVNGLWFASLITSLATASFSMLVKQWLREYLAVEYTAAQERLRARQYRRPALEKWQVFEIAAVLPILLQISLGLFFLGLCFFTANIDERMGRACVPLVCGWAFFLIATTLAPLLSPRCPYKMPLLKFVMRLTRTRVTMKVRHRLTSLIADMWGVREPSLEKQDASLEYEEEDQVVTGDQDDKDILLSMDAIMADDNLLMAMWVAFKQRSTGPAQSLTFIVELMVSRLGSKADYLLRPRLRRIPDLTPLSRRAWDAFMEMLADLASRRTSGPLLVTSPEWLHKATIILFSDSPYPLPSTAVACLQALLGEAPGFTASKSIVQWIAADATEEPFEFHPLSNRLLPVYENLASSAPCLLPIFFVYSEFLRPYCPAPLPIQPLYDLLSQNPGVFTHPATLPILEDMWTLTFANLFVESRSDGTSNASGMSEGIAILLDFSDRMDRWAEVAVVLANFWENRPVTYIVLGYAFTALHRQPRLSGAHLLRLCLDAFNQSRNQQRMIECSAGVAQAYVDGVYDDESEFTQMGVVRFCFLHVWLYANYNKDGTAQHSIARIDRATRYQRHIPWADLWRGISAALRRYADGEKWRAGYFPQYWHLSTLTQLTPEELLAEDRRLAGQCLEIIESMEHKNETSSSSPSAPPEPVFPQELADALGFFILPEEAAKYTRLGKSPVKGKSIREAPGSVEYHAAGEASN